MKIDLSPADRKIIVDALKIARREAMNQLDWSTDEACEESDEFQGEIDRKYDRLIDLIEDVE